MATTFKPLYGTSNQAITITLASLAASPTVGRESTVIDNSGALFDDILLFLLLEAGVVSGNKQALIFAYGTADGGTTYTEGCTGVNAAFTRQDPTNLKSVAQVALPTASIVYKLGPYSLKQVFGTLPDHWGLVVCNDSGVAFSGTAGNNKAFYQGVNVQGV